MYTSDGVRGPIDVPVPLLSLCPFDGAPQQQLPHTSVRRRFLFRWSGFLVRGDRVKQHSPSALRRGADKLGREWAGWLNPRLINAAGEQMVVGG